MSKWTPGPWDTANDGRDVISASTGYIVCETSGNEANARLVAAAPEMAELLDRLMNALLVYDGHVSDETNAAGWTEREPYEAFMDARALLAKVNA